MVRNVSNKWPKMRDCIPCDIPAQMPNPPPRIAVVIITMSDAPTV